MMNIPVVIEPFTTNDFKFYFNLVNNERVMAMITERALPLEEAQREFEQLIANNQLDEQFGSFKIIHETTREFIGLAKLEIEEVGSETAELGYIVLPEYWGRGLGTWVAQILVENARKQPHLKQLLAIIDPKNIPSRKILIRCGFTSKEFMDFDGLPGELLELKLQ